MKAIRTRYSGPTNTRGSRFTACDSDGNRVTLSYDYALNADENHEKAAYALMGKMGWTNKLIGGGFGNDMYWTMIPVEKPAELGKCGVCKGRGLILKPGKPAAYCLACNTTGIQQWDYQA